MNVILLSEWFTRGILADLDDDDVKKSSNALLFILFFFAHKDLHFLIFKQTLCNVIISTQCIDKARDLLDAELTAMAGESYSRAYGVSILQNSPDFRLMASFDSRRIRPAVRKRDDIHYVFD